MTRRSGTVAAKRASWRRRELKDEKGVATEEIREPSAETT